MSLITLPLRLGRRAGGLALRGLWRAVELAPFGPTADAAAPRPESAATPAATPARRTARPGSGAADRPPPARDERPPPPPHVSEEPDLVAEFAEPGAEEGAGPELHVSEPWEGYDRMGVQDIAAQLGAAEVEVAAAVRLYEGANRSRKGVLEAAERRLRG